MQKQSLTVSAAGISALQLTADSYAKVPYNTEQVDELAQLEGGTFTAAGAGDYLVCASVLTGSTAANPDELVLHRGGVREKGLRYGNNVLDGCRVLRLAAGEQIDVFVYSRTTASLTSNASWDALTVSKLR